MELQQKSLLQTAVAVFTNLEGAEIQVPLFSKKPIAGEVPALLKRFPNLKLKHVYFSNALLGTALATSILEFVYKYGILPENYLNDLRTGFSFIYDNRNFSVHLSYC